MSQQQYLTGEWVAINRRCDRYKSELTTALLMLGLKSGQSPEAAFTSAREYVGQIDAELAAVRKQDEMYLNVARRD